MKISLPYPSPEASQILWDLRARGQQAIPIGIDDALIHFELTPLNDMTRVNVLKKWFISLRAISLTVVILPCLTVFFYLYQVGMEFNSLVAAVALLIPCLLLLSVNVMNDVKDHLRLIDLRGSKGGSGVIQKGWLLPRELTRFSYGLLGLAALLSMPIILDRPLLLMLILPLTLISVIGYSGGFFNFKYRALGDIVVFLCCGPLLTIGYSLAVFNTISYEISGLGCFYGILACAILHANNLNDITVDSSRGAKTLATTLGFKKSQWLLVWFYGLSYLCLSFLALTSRPGWWRLSLVLLNLIPIFFLLKNVFRAHSPDDPILADIRFRTPQIHLLTGILLCLGIVFFKT